MNLLEFMLFIETSEKLSDEEKEKFKGLVEEIIEQEKDWNRTKKKFLDRKMQRGGSGAHKTVHNLERYIGIFEKFFEDTYDYNPSFLFIDEDTMFAFVAWMKKQKKWKKGEPWSPSYIHKIYMSVVEFFEFAGVPETYAMKQNAPKFKEKEYIDTYTDEEVRIIFSLLTKETFLEFRDRINFLLKLVTGARTSEIDNLRWSDFNFNTHKFRVNMKGDIRAMKYVPEPVWSELMEYRAAWERWVPQTMTSDSQKTDRLFFKVDADGKISDISDRFFYQRLKKKVKKYNRNRKESKPYIDPRNVNNKNFRSYLIGVEYDLSTSIEDTARLVDHLDPKTTRRYYVKIERERKEDLYKTLMPEMKRRKIV